MHGSGPGWKLESIHSITKLNEAMNLTDIPKRPVEAGEFDRWERNRENNDSGGN